jgi:hypothetical protein
MEAATEALMGDIRGLVGTLCSKAICWVIRQPRNVLVVCHKIRGDMYVGVMCNGVP